MNKTRLLPLLLLVLTSVTACGSAPKSTQVSLPSSDLGQLRNLEAPSIPPLSPALSAEPKPSGAYWNDVTLFRNDWQQTLKD